MEFRVKAGDEQPYIVLLAENDLRRYNNNIILTIGEALALLDSEELKTSIATALTLEEPRIKLHKKNVALAKKLGVLKWAENTLKQSLKRWSLARQR